MSQPATVEKVYLPICHACGERPWPAQARATEVRCDACGRVLDHFRVLLMARATAPFDSRPLAAAA